MLPLDQRIAFLLFAAITSLLGARGFYRLWLRIHQGKPAAEPRTNDLARRLWYALTTTLLQTRVFRARRVLSVFHSFIFYAFVLYMLVNTLDLVDGFTPLPTIVPPAIVAIYGLLTDLFSVLAIIGVLAFVLRRFALPAKKDLAFPSRTLLQPKVLDGYIKHDSLIVAAFILFHIGSRIIGNAARLASEGPQPTQPFTTLLAPLFAGPHALAWRVFGYWGALGSVLLFLVYFPYSKHVHLLLAPVNYLFERKRSGGELPLATIDLEAAEPQIGAAYLADLAWPRLLDSYACIQCNRCQDVCPASATGKALSPAALEINKRMVLNTIASERSAFALTGTAPFERGGNPGPRLTEAVISPEAVWGCTTCGACMEVCPTQDEQMLDIIDIRRNLVMAEGEFPAQLQTAFRGMERHANPWGLARDKRMDWAQGLTVPTVDQVPDPDVLYWVGCAASYDPGAQKTARAVVQLLTEARVRFAVLGKRECCTGDSARRAGNELLYQQLAGEAVQTLQSAKPKLVLASCPHCVNAIGTEYPQLAGNFNVMHHTEYLAGLVANATLSVPKSSAKITFHDPCYLGRHRGTYDAPRQVLTSITTEYIDLPRTRSNAFCCGAGGAQFWKEEEPGTERISENRFREAQGVLASGTDEDQPKVLAVGCPFCKSMLQSTPAAGGDDSIVVKDVAELLWEGIESSRHPVAAFRSEESQLLFHQQPQTPVLAAPHAEPDVPSAPAPSIPSEAEATAPASSALAKRETEPAAPVVRKQWAPRKPAPQTAAPETVPSLAEDMLIPGPDRAPEPTAEEAPKPRKKWQPGVPK